MQVEITFLNCSLNNLCCLTDLGRMFLDTENIRHLVFCSGFSSLSCDLLFSFMAHSTSRFLRSPLGSVSVVYVVLQKQY